MAIDKATNQAYIAESRPIIETAKVIRVDLSTGTSATITTGPAGSACVGIALDPVNQHYTLDDQSSSFNSDQLRRVDYNGNNDMLLLSGFVNVAGPLSIDLANNRLFAIDARPSASKIINIDLTDNTFTTLVNSTSIVTGLAYDSRINEVYYTVSDDEAESSIDQLRRINPATMADQLVLGNFSANVPGNISLDGWV